MHVRPKQVLKIIKLIQRDICFETQSRKLLQRTARDPIKRTLLKVFCIGSTRVPTYRQTFELQKTIRLIKIDASTEDTVGLHVRCAIIAICFR